ncbi:putative SOSS complex subunit B1 [Hypsibius exemplaris]|uniref:SOSS complex subunit B1 n=1 Tax=Hypsibius exemplaris TaxID=2072580 RepID=A0A1W0WSD0_HYPEX|nr:putative SOSS complex subunit B1 [Hypsibius exemplaris]
MHHPSTTFTPRTEGLRGRELTSDLALWASPLPPLGMSAITAAPPSGFLHVRDLKHGLKNVNIDFMILEPNGMNRTKDGDQVWVFKVADSTASINFAVIGDAGQFLKPGDVCKVLNGFCSIFKGALTFYVGKSGTFKRTGEFCFLISEEVNMSLYKPPPTVAPQQANSDGRSVGSSDARRTSDSAVSQHQHHSHKAGGSEQNPFKKLDSHHKHHSPAPSSSSSSRPSDVAPVRRRRRSKRPKIIRLSTVSSPGISLGLILDDCCWPLGNS